MVIVIKIAHTLNISLCKTYFGKKLLCEIRIFFKIEKKMLYPQEFLLFI